MAGILRGHKSRPKLIHIPPKHFARVKHQGVRTNRIPSHFTALVKVPPGSETALVNASLSNVPRIGSDTITSLESHVFTGNSPADLLHEVSHDVTYPTPKGSNHLV